MKRVTLYMCFIDEEDNIVAKKDLNVSWNLKGPDNKSEIKNILVMDEVSDMLSYQIKSVIDECVRELLDEVQRSVK